MTHKIFNITNIKRRRIPTLRVERSGLINLSRSLLRLVGSAIEKPHIEVIETTTEAGHRDYYLCASDSIHGIVLSRSQDSTFFNSASLARKLLSAAQVVGESCRLRISETPTEVAGRNAYLIIAHPLTVQEP